MASQRILDRVKNSGPLLLASLVGLLFAVWGMTGDFSGIEATTVNARFKLRNLFFPWQEHPHDIVFIDINDHALATNVHGPQKVPERWPWPRCQWAVLHDWFKKYGIKPAAVVYDIVFDLADDSKLAQAPAYTIVGGTDSVDLEEETNDQFFARALEETPHIPTFLAALLIQLNTEPYSDEDYQARFQDDESYGWVPPPPAFTRHGIVYEPGVHGPVFHARELAIPWDSEWWSEFVKTPREQYEELEFMGETTSLLKPAAGAGNTTMDPEEDGVTRWAPLFIEYNGYLYPSLPLQVVLHQFKIDASDVRFEEGAVVLPRKIGTEVRIPVDERKRMMLNFRYGLATGKEAESREGFLTLNYWKVADAFTALRPDSEQRVDFNPHELNDKIIIIGSSAAGTFDLRAIPIEQRFPAVRTIGTIIRSIEQEDFLREAPRWVNFLWTLGGAFLVGVLGQFFAPIKHAVATILLVVVHTLCTFFLFAHMNVVANFFHVTSAEIFAYIVVTISQYLQVSTLFGRYVTPEVRRFLMSNRSALELGGQETEVSILFSDLKGFTSMSEKLEAKEVIGALNDYFGPMFQIIIDENNGTLDKLIGDAIMAYFGHPLPQPGHPLQAVTAALMMQRRLAELREIWAAEGKPTIRMRIGVNTGKVVAGNMGSAGRTDYSIIGDNVNLAARLESAAPVDGVLISESTYQHVKDHFIFNEKDPIQVKGKEKPVKVYEVVDFK